MEAVLLRRRAAHGPWRPRNPPPTWPSRQRPGGTRRASGARPSAAVGAMSFLVLRSWSSRCQRLSVERPPVHATARDPSSFPHPPTMDSRESGNPWWGAGGVPHPATIKTAQPPEATGGSPKAINHPFCTFQLQYPQKTLEPSYEAKHSNQVRASVAGVDPLAWEAYRAWWPGGRPTHRPGGDSWQERKARSRGTCARRT